MPSGIFISSNGRLKKSFKGENPIDAMMLRLCTFVHDTPDMPSIINAIAGDAELLGICRNLTAPPNRAVEKRLIATCQAQRLDAGRVQRRVLNVARSLRLAPMPFVPDYYAVLGVPVTADPATIRHAFREKAKLLHPDRRKESPEAFLELQAAYRCLSDAGLRSRYDEESRNSGMWFESEEAAAAGAAETRRRRDWGRPAAMVGILLLVLMTAALVFDLFYNESDFFGGARPGSPRQKLPLQAAPAGQTASDARPEVQASPGQDTPVGQLHQEPLPGGPAADTDVVQHSESMEKGTPAQRRRQ